MQRWRGNVKARHFVLALRDYCLEKLDKLRKNEQTFTECDYPTRITEQDEWTLEYINVTRLQAIIEAFDDDASGFITVGEANAFTTSRPADWRCDQAFFVEASIENPIHVVYSTGWRTGLSVSYLNLWYEFSS